MSNNKNCLRGEDSAKTVESAAFVAHTVRFLVVSLSSTLSLCLSLRSVRSRQRQCLCLVLPDRIVLLPVRVFSLLSRGRRGVRGCLSLHFHGFRTAPRHCRFPCVSTAHAAKTNCLLSLRFHLIRERDTSSCDRASVTFLVLSVTLRRRQCVYLCFQIIGQFHGSRWISLLSPALR